MGKIFDSLKQVIREKFEVTEYEIPSTGGTTSHSNPLTSVPSWNLDKAQSEREVVKARNFVESNNYAKRDISILLTNVLSDTGIMLQGSRELRLRWGTWNSKADLDRASWFEFQNQCMRHIFRDGEVIIEYLNLDGELRLRLHDPLTCDRDMGKHGIKLDSKRQPIEYYFKGRSNTSIAIPAERILHVYVKEYVDQVRGLSWMRTLKEPLTNLKTYQNSVVVNATANVMSGGLIKIPDARNPRQTTKAEVNRIVDLRPGQRMIVGKDTEYEAFETDFPAGAYAEIRRGELGEAAAGVNLSQFAQSGDLDKANFSSLRQGRIEDVANYKRIQNIAKDINSHIFSMWADFYRITSREVANALRGGMPVWVAPGHQYIEPVKENQAIIMLIDKGLEARSSRIIEMGRNPEEVFDRIIDDYNYFIEKNAPPELISAIFGVSPSVPTPSEQEEKDDNEDEEQEVDE